MADDLLGVVTATGFPCTAQQAGREFLVIGCELQDDVQRVAAVGQNPVQIVNLFDGARVPVQEEALLHIGLAEPVPDRLLAAAGYRAINGHALSFERLERLSERTHRLSAQGALKWDAALAASLEVPQELVRPLMSELGFVTEGKRAEESYKRRRQSRAAPVPPPDPDSPFSVLARLRETSR